MLEVQEGVVYESTAIMRYIADLRPELKLNGESIFDKSQVDLWALNTNVIMGVVSPLIKAITGREPRSKEDIDKLLTTLPERMKLFEDRLSERTFLVGYAVTTADLSLLSVLYLLFTFGLEEKERHKYPHILRYYNNLTSSKIFTSVFGNQKRLTNKMWKLVPVEGQKSAEVKQAEEKKDPKVSDKKDSKAPKPTESKDVKPKKEEKVKTELKEEAKKVEKPAESETTFDLYNFKTLFVNEIDRKKVVEFAVSNYDKNHFSFWHAHYDKHAAEGKELVPFNNLLTNFCQRLADLSLTKNIIGIHGIYGEEPDLQINGLWLWKSADFYEGLKDHPSNEYVKWTKINPSNASDRQRIEEYWANIKSEIGTVEGQRCRTLKIIK